MCVQLSHFAVQQKLLKYCNQLFFNKIKKYCLSNLIFWKNIIGKLISLNISKPKAGCINRFVSCQEQWSGILLQDGKSRAFSSPWRAHIEPDNTMLEFCLPDGHAEMGLFVLVKLVSISKERRQLLWMEVAIWKCSYHVSRTLPHIHFAFYTSLGWKTTFPFRIFTCFIHIPCSYKRGYGMG